MSASMALLAQQRASQVQTILQQNQVFQQALKSGKITQAQYDTAMASQNQQLTDLGYTAPRPVPVQEAPQNVVQTPTPNAQISSSLVEQQQQVGVLREQNAVFAEAYASGKISKEQYDTAMTAQNKRLAELTAPKGGTVGIFPTNVQANTSILPMAADFGVKTGAVPAAIGVGYPEAPDVRANPMKYLAPKAIQVAGLAAIGVAPAAAIGGALIGEGVNIGVQSTVKSFETGQAQVVLPSSAKEVVQVGLEGAAFSVVGGGVLKGIGQVGGATGRLIAGSEEAVAAASGAQKAGAAAARVGVNALLGAGGGAVMYGAMTDTKGATIKNEAYKNELIAQRDAVLSDIGKGYEQNEAYKRDLVSAFNDLQKMPVAENDADALAKGFGGYITPAQRDVVLSDIGKGYEQYKQTNAQLISDKETILAQIGKGYEQYKINKSQIESGFADAVLQGALFGAGFGLAGETVGVIGKTSAGQRVSSGLTNLKETVLGVKATELIGVKEVYEQQTVGKETTITRLTQPTTKEVTIPKSQAEFYRGITEQKLDLAGTERAKTIKTDFDNKLVEVTKFDQPIEQTRSAEAILAAAKKQEVTMGKVRVGNLEDMVNIDVPASVKKAVNFGSAVEEVKVKTGTGRIGTAEKLGKDSGVVLLEKTVIHSEGALPEGLKVSERDFTGIKLTGKSDIATEAKVPDVFLKSGKDLEQLGVRSPKELELADKMYGKLGGGSKMNEDVTFQRAPKNQGTKPFDDYSKVNTKLNDTIKENFGGKASTVLEFKENVVAKGRGKTVELPRPIIDVAKPTGLTKGSAWGATAGAAISQMQQAKPINPAKLTPRTQPTRVSQVPTITIIGESSDQKSRTSPVSVVVPDFSLPIMQDQPTIQIPIAPTTPKHETPVGPLPILVPTPERRGGVIPVEVPINIGKVGGGPVGVVVPKPIEGSIPKPHLPEPTKPVPTMPFPDTFAKSKLQAPFMFPRGGGDRSGGLFGRRRGRLGERKAPIPEPSQLVGQVLGTRHNSILKQPHKVTKHNRSKKR